MKTRTRLAAITSASILALSGFGCGSDKESDRRTDKEFTSAVDDFALRVGEFALTADPEQVPGYKDLICHPFYCDFREGGQYTAKRYLRGFEHTAGIKGARALIFTEYQGDNVVYKPEDILAFQVNIGACAVKTATNDCGNTLETTNEQRYLFIRYSTEPGSIWSISTIIPGPKLTEMIWKPEDRDNNLEKVEEIFSLVEEGEPIQ